MRKAFVVTDCDLCLKNYFYIQIDETRMKITGSFTFVQASLRQAQGPGQVR